MKIQDELLHTVPELARYVHRPSYFAANGLYWAVAALFAVVQAGMMPLYWLLSALGNIDPVGFTTSVQLLMYVGAMLLPLWIYTLTHHRECAALRLSRPRAAALFPALLIAAAGFLAANFTTTLWLLLLEAFGWAAPAAEAFTGSLPLDLFMIALVPGVCEELLFRGMIMGAYERRGTWPAIWISALLFTGMHGSVAGIPAQLMLGLVLGYAAASAGSVVVPMVIHICYNAVTVITSYSAPADNSLSAPLLEQIGGMSGAAVCAFMAMLSVLLLAWALRLLDRTRRRAGEPFGMDAVIEPAPMSHSEVILLISGVVTVIWFYLQNFLGL